MKFKAAMIILMLAFLVMQGAIFWRLSRVEFEIVNNWKNPSLMVGTLDCPVLAGGIININERIGEVE
jgi:hypothetical protein